MLQRRLRILIFDAEHYCPMCDAVVDIYGDRALVVAATTRKGTHSFASVRINTVLLLFNPLSWSILVSCVPDP